jgi:hypothetical protein
MSRKLHESKILILYSLYIEDTILYVKEKGRCIINYQIHTYNVRTSPDYHQHIHELYDNKATVLPSCLCITTFALGFMRNGIQPDSLASEQSDVVA